MTKISLTKKHEPVDVVDLVGPEGGEDEIHLDEDTAKGQYTPDKNYHCKQDDHNLSDIWVLEFQHHFVIFIFFFNKGAYLRSANEANKRKVRYEKKDGKAKEQCFK